MTPRKDQVWIERAGTALVRITFASDDMVTYERDGNSYDAIPPSKFTDRYQPHLVDKDLPAHWFTVFCPERHIQYGQRLVTEVEAHDVADEADASPQCASEDHEIFEHWTEFEKVERRDRD